MYYAPIRPVYAKPPEQTLAVVEESPIDESGTTTIETPAPDSSYCSCILYLRNIEKIAIPPVSAIWFQSFKRSPPKVGSLALFSYGEGELKQHIALVVAMDSNGFTVREANYKPCEKTTRWIPWDDNNLIGFFDN